MKKGIFLFFVSLFLFSFTSCIKEEEEKEEITSFKFESTNLQVGKGSSTAVRLVIEPQSRIKDAKVTYTLSDPQSQTVYLSNETSSGLVVNAEKGGSVVVIAKCEGLTSFLEVDVFSDILSDNPFIELNETAFELNKGSRKSFLVNLSGGSKEDEALFTYSVSDENIIRIDTANNAVMVEALEKGFSFININHPKVSYQARVMVFVDQEKENPVYISTEKPVLLLGKKSGTKNVFFNLINSKVNNLSLFTYEITEGNENIEIIANNNVLSVTPKASGNANVKVKHAESQIDYILHVIVVDEDYPLYIDSEDSFFDLYTGESVRTVLTVEGGDGTVITNPTYQLNIENEDIVEARIVNDILYIKGLKEGKSRIYVSSSLCMKDHEIFVTVGNNEETLYYINTDKPVIRMEEGESDVELPVTLWGGNTSDNNSFKWTVSDSEIIEVYSSFGNVEYSRSVYSGNENTKVSAYINAKKPGKALITVSNPKSFLDQVITVIVYPKGTLKNIMPSVKGSSLFKVINGQMLESNITFESGSMDNVSFVMENEEIASYSVNDDKIYFYAVAGGVTTFKIIFNEKVIYSATVACGTESEINNMHLLEADKASLEIIKSQTSYVRINALEEYDISVSDNTVLEVNGVSDVISVKGINEGTAIIHVTAEGYLNAADIYVKVLNETSITKPYYFSYDRFFSCVKGNVTPLTVNVSTDESYVISSVMWEIEDENIALINGSGKTCIITPLQKGVTKIKAKSSYCSNECEIILNIVENEGQLNVPVLYADKKNIVSKLNENVYLNVECSVPSYTDSIVWSSSDISVVNITSEKNFCIAGCRSKGSAVVQASIDEYSSVNFYISVVEDVNENSDIFFPQFLELTKGESIVIDAQYSSLTESELEKIIYTVSDPSVIELKGNGKSFALKAKETGFSDITVTLSEKGIYKKISVEIFEKGTERLPVILSEKSLYNMSKGDVIDFDISFGTIKPTENMINGITFETDNEYVEVHKTGKHFSLIAKEEGKTQLTIKGEGFLNECKIVILTGNNESINSWSFSCESIVKMVRGSERNINISIVDLFYNNNINAVNEITVDVSDTQFIDVIHNNNVINITAKQNGRSEIILHSDLVSKDFKIIVIVAETQSELDEIFVINARKQNYLLNIGEECDLQIDCDGKNTNLLTWRADNSSICTFDVSADKKTLHVKARKEGNAAFTVSHPSSSNEIVFYVSITALKHINDINYITPSVVLIEKNRIIQQEDEEEGIPLIDLKKYISIISSMSEENAQNLIWTSSNENIAKITGYSKQALLEGIEKGFCDINVGFDTLNNKTIVCKVCENQEEINNSTVWNIDERYMVLRQGDEKNVRPYSLSKSYDISKTVITDVYQNNVVECKIKNNMLCFKALNEGIALLNISNSDCENSFNVTVEVNTEGTSVISEGEKGSLQAVQTLYTLDSTKPDKSVLISVTPIDIEEKYWSNIIFENLNPGVCTVISNKNSASVFPKEEGICDIRCYSFDSVNEIYFRIICSKENQVSFPYLRTEKNNMKLKAGEISSFDFTVQNMADTDVTKYSYSVEDSSIVSIVNQGESVEVRALKAGQTVLTARYEGLDEVHCVISVSGVVENICYLVTDEQYVFIPKDMTRKIGVRLKGYNETNQDNFHWSYKNEEEKQYLTFSGSGNEIFIKGIKEGNCTLICTHQNSDPLTSAICPVEITVMISEDENFKPVYIKTDNVVFMKKGTNESISVELVNGNESEYGLFSWKTRDDSKGIVKVTGSGNQAILTGIEVGVGKITVSHPSVFGMSETEIIVVVNENEEDGSLVITTDSTVIEGKLSDSYKTVNVRLSGGKAEDLLKFSWEIISNDSVEKNSDGTSLPVVQLVSQSGEQNIVKYLREGVSVVRVRNSSTSHFLDIKFIINEYTNLRFETSNVTIKEYEGVSVSLNCPSSKTVVYNSSDESICMAYGTNKVCMIEGIKQGFAVITARTTDGLYSDQISVRVNKNNSSVPVYIVSSTSLVSLNVSDKSGYKLKAGLSGTIGGEAVNESENQFLKWKVKENNNDVIRFTGNNPLEGSGNEAVIVPVNAGQCTIEVTHPKCDKTKEIYVEVKSVSASLRLDETYGVYEKGDIGSISASLSGVPLSEEENITWNISDTNIIAFNDNGVEKTSVKGSSAVFRCKELCENGITITCSYKDSMKTYTVFIKALPSLHIVLSNDLVRTGQSKWYNIVCTPEDYVSDLSYTYSSSSFVNVSEGGVMMTGLVKNESELVLSKDNPPEGIRPPYFKVTGGMREGSTSFNFECKSLTAVLNIKTDNTVLLTLNSFDEYDKKGKIIKHIDTPSIIEVSADSSYTRVYYSVEPEVEITQFKNTSYTGYLSNAFREGTVTLLNGKNTGADRYFDLKTDSEGCNWGDLKLTIGEEVIGYLRCSFTMKDADKNFTFICQDNTPLKYYYDVVNGIVRGAGKANDVNSGTQAVMKLNYESPYYYATFDERTGTYSKVYSQTNLFSNAPRFYSSKNLPGKVIEDIRRSNTSVLVKFYYPSSYGLVGEYSKYFIFYEEIWK